MAANRAYLDHNASAPLRECARVTVIEALSAANPSSVHSEGRAARKLVETARASVAALVSAKPDHVVFTSGATEAASLLLSPSWQMGRGAVRMSRLYVCAADHPCLLGGGRFSREAISVIGVDGDGLIDLVELQTTLAGHDHGAGLPLVAVHLANNETGVVQQAAEISAIVKASGGVLIFDAVQAAGRISVNISAGYADYLILSSHKIGGPKGAGAIVAASDLMMPQPLVTGGGQERGHRAGTEALPAIAGFGAAAVEALAELPRMGAVEIMRDDVERAIMAAAPDARIFGDKVSRLPNTSFFAIPGFKAETAQIAFDLAGVALSAGSACSSGKVGPSHVLKAMGVGDEGGALRLSIGASTTREEIGRFETVLATMLARRNAAGKAA